MAIDLIGRGSSALGSSLDSLLGTARRGDPTGISGSYSNYNGLSNDPTGIAGSPAKKLGFDPLLDGAGWTFGTPESTNPQTSGGMSYGGTGGSLPSSAGGEWAQLDRFNTGFANASSNTSNKVPANLLKAVLAVEGSYGNDWGRAPVTVGPGRTVNPFNGMMQTTAQANGYDWNRIMTDPNYAIWTSADVLDRLYSQYGGQYGWDGVVRAYFSGNPAPSNWTDELGNNTNAYHDNVVGKWQHLDSLGGSNPSQDPANGGYPASGGGGGSFSAIWGGKPNVPITFEFHGRGGPDLYGYGTAYGLNGSEHTGVDVGVPLNSNLYAPMSGTVTCAGTNNGPGTNGGGCSAFNDVMGGGNGRIEIQLDNGSVIILGHTSASRVQPGQRVSAGQLVGLSGGMNGAHVHVEARVRDPSMSSGWRIVDPRQVLGGAFTGSYSASGPGSGYGSGTSAPQTMQQTIYNYMMGRR
jgi:murein DD-endopeptidase MepM/ murein hydrolase activator NlpD